MKYTYKKIAILSLVLSVILMYLFTAFILNDFLFNPSEWERYERVIFLLVWIIVVAFIGTGFEAISKSEHSKPMQVRNSEVETQQAQENKFDGELLEEILFLVSDLLHNAEYQKISLKEIGQIMIEARLFTRYANQNRPELKERHEQFITYLKNNMWKKVYGKTFGEFNK